MHIAISGSSGLIGKRLRGRLEQLGHTVLSLERHRLYEEPAALATILQGADAVIHLSGAPILQRWSGRKLETIRASRILTTRTLVNAMQGMKNPPRILVSLSAVGIYDQSPAQTESSDRLATDTLGQLCRDWEREAQPASAFTRLVILRMGVVLDPEGGALKRMLPAFRLGLGGPIATGRQGMPWIHHEDVVQAFLFVLKHEVRGVFNLCAPQSASNLEFSKILAHTLHRPCLFRIPAFLLHGIYGPAAAVITGGQQAVPENLLRAGFNFTFPSLDGALRHLIQKQ